MKRLDIIQLAIIIAGIISVLFFVESVPSFLFYMYTWATDGLRGGYYLQAFFSSVIYLAAYSLIALYAFKNSKALAEKICDKAVFNSDINFNLNKGELLASTFVGIAVYGLIRNVPAFLTDLYKMLKPFDNLKTDVVSYKGLSVGQYLFQETALVGLYIVLLVYANVFADFFSKKINNIEPPDTINLKEDE